MTGYYDPCPHGYVPTSCAECRAAARPADPDPVGERFERFMAAHRDGNRAGWLVRRTEVTADLARLEGYSRRSNAQEAELDELTGELTVLSSLIDQDDVQVRRSKIEHGRAVMADPANREGPEGGVGVPALVTRIGERPESAGEILQRMRSNPWQSPDGLINRADTAAGLIARAHTALEGLEQQLSRPGCERLAEAFAESGGWPGMTVTRSRDEQAQAAELFLALSNPHYHEAFRNVLRYPGEYMLGGTGYEIFTDEQKQAWRDVRTNMVVRAAFAETSGAAGAFALPLQLDPTVMVINAGVVGPFRKLARTVIGTSNVWEGITSQGSTANWVAEGAAVTDTTPTLAQVAITPFKSAVWVFGSLEVIGDTQLDQQVPGLIAEARSRLELTSFTTGTGSAQPFGVITRGASDATVGALAAPFQMIFEQLDALVGGFPRADPSRVLLGGDMAQRLADELVFLADCGVVSGVPGRF